MSAPPRLFVALAVLLSAALLAAAPRGTAPGHAAGPAAASERPDLRPFFSGLPGTFVLLDGKTGERVYYARERAGVPVIPASTFKIPNTLIALETGVASGPDFALFNSWPKPRRAEAVRGILRRLGAMPSPAGPAPRR